MVVVIGDEQRTTRVLDELGKQSNQRCFRGYHYRVRAHLFTHMHRLENVDVLPLVNVDATAQQLECVDGRRLHLGCQERCGDAADHQWEDDFVISGQLENDEDRRDRCVRAGRDDRSHSHQRIRPGPGRARRPNGMNHGSDSSAEHGANEERRGEDAAGPSRTDRDRHGDDLEHDEEQHEFPDHGSLQCIVDGFVAHTEHLGQPHADDSDHGTADQRFDRRINAHLVEKVFRRIQRSRERQGGQPRQQAKGCIG